MANYVQNPLGTETAMIANGASLSAAINLGGLRLFGIVMPTAWSAANITFQASYDGGVSWSSLYDDAGNELSITASAARCIVLDPVNFAAIPMLKVRSGTSASPVNQGGDRAITLVLRSV